MLSCGSLGLRPSRYRRRNPAQVSGMICISPIAPFGDTAFAWPRLSTRITARIQLSGMPNRCDASAISAAKGSAGLTVAIGADCACADAAQTALIEPPVTVTAIAVMIAFQPRTPPPNGRERAIVLASVKGKAGAGLRPPPDQVRGRLLTDAARDGSRDADRDERIDRLSIEQRDWMCRPGAHGITPSHG